MPLRRVGDLEIDQDLEFQQREWRAERAGWSALVFVIVLAGAGVFGHGPVSWSTTSAPDGTLSLDYEEFGRRGGTQDLVIRVAASEAQSGKWAVDVDGKYAAGLVVQAVNPEPDSVESTDQSVRYTFSQQRSSASLEATFSMRPATLWSTTGRVSVPGGSSVVFRQFFFP